VKYPYFNIRRKADPPWAQENAVMEKYQQSLPATGSVFARLAAKQL
jgi:hypothetical protein